MYPPLGQFDPTYLYLTFARAFRSLPERICSPQDVVQERPKTDPEKRPPQNEFFIAGTRLFNVRDVLASQADNPNAVARIKNRTDSPVLVAPAIVSSPEKTVGEYPASAA